MTRKYFSAIACAVSLWLGLSSASHAADFNGDGKQDILWRTPAGNPLVWQMNGLSIGTTQALVNAPDASSAIVGAGKFFGASPPGILWVDSSNRLSLWQVSNGIILQECVVASGIDPGWHFLGIGDINADGRDDVLWRLPNGNVNAFLMNGCVAPQTVTLNASADPSWTLAGVGDVDSNSCSDLLWQDVNSNIVLWQIGSNATVSNATTLNAGAYAGWTASGVADFNGDGKADILWRDSSGSNAALWLMNGTQHIAAPIVPGSPSVFDAADTVFMNGFENGQAKSPALTSNWTILGAADFNGDGDADILLVNNEGDTAIWQMQGAIVQATTLLPPIEDMPLPGLTGWVLPLDRPSITKANNNVIVQWPLIAGSPTYTVYASATHFPASSGVRIPVSGTSLSFARNATGYADKRYFAVSAAYQGIQLPPSQEAYIVEFSLTNLPYWGAMAIADFNGDGCTDILGALGNCYGGFQLHSEADMGLSALRASGRVYRDVRFADFNGDGILDAIANVYSCDVPWCGSDDSTSHIQLFWGNVDGTFTQDTAFDALNVPGGGYGETIVVADFNNDGSLDIFLPKYTAYDSSEHSFLLLNDGHGNFTDVSDVVGIAMRNVPICGRPEGAQAIDINSDGWIDLYAGSDLFINQGSNSQGIPIFQNMGPAIDQNCNVVSASPWGLPEYFDEGAKFIDLDNSGQLALVLNTVYTYFPPSGLHFLKFDGVSHFSEVYIFPPDLYMNQSFGLTAADVDGDGLTDIVIAGGCDANKYNYPESYPDPYCFGVGNPHAPPQLLVNRGGQFVLHDFYNDELTTIQRYWSDLQTFADFDNSGTVDFVSRFSYFQTGASNTEDGTSPGFLSVSMNKAVNHNTLIVTVVGDNGEHNQAGRVVRVSPNSRPGVIMTQVIDGGSGYLANSPYDLAFATPYLGSYTIAVRFANATYTTTADTGDHVMMYANGTVTHQ